MICHESPFARAVPAALVSLVLACSAALADPPQLRDPDRRVDCNCGFLVESTAEGVDLAMRGNSLYVVYLDQRYLFSSEPYINVSVNQGGTWNAQDRRLNSQPAGAPEGDMSLVRVAAGADNRVYVLYATDELDFSVPYVRTSPDGGQTWPGLPVALTSSGLGVTRYEFRIAAGGPGVAYGIWCDTSAASTDRSVYMRRTVDGGTNWLPAQKVNVLDSALGSPREKSSEPAACTDGADGVFFAWKDKRDLEPNSFSTKPGRIVFRGSLNRGQTFGSEIRLDRADAGIETESQEPAIACAPTGHVAVAWEDARAGSTDLDVYVNVSADRGATWFPAEIRVDAAAPAGALAQNPRVALGGGTPPVIYVAWEDDRAGGRDLYLSRSADAGASWTPPQRVNLGVEAGLFPVESWALAAEGTNVAVAWADNRAGSVTDARRDVFVVRSTDSGATFGDPQRLDLGTGQGASDSVRVVAGASADGVAAVFRDLRSDVRGDIYSGGFGVVYNPQDADADGIALARDNCPDAPNAAQTDGDFDGVGNACDVFPTDSSNDPDGEGIPSQLDNCPLDANSDQQTNTDLDPFGEACDLCDTVPDTVVRDLDRDRVGDACDPNVDNDAQPDASDPDDDNDGVPDTSDNCRTVPNARQLNDDGDAAGNACDDDDLRVSDLRVGRQFGPPALVYWERENAATTYNVYLGPVSKLASGHPGFCLAPDVSVPLHRAAAMPGPGEAFFYLATAKSGTTEGSTGRRSNGTERGRPACNASLAADWDADGDVNGLDNCRFDANADQADGDADNVGNVCDAFPSDPLNDATDGDGVGTDADNCPFAANPQQADADGDGRGDACDACPAAADPLPGDADGDGIDDACDPDIDDDGVANDADEDRDGDGVPDATDNCVGAANGAQLDRDGDGLGDACDVAVREALGLTIARSPDRLTWVRSPGAIDYSVLSGFVDELADGPPLGSCYGPRTALPFQDVPGGLIAGQARWYLVRPRYADGEGSAGRDSAGGEREVADCP